MAYTQSRWKLDALLPSNDETDVKNALSVFEKKVKKVEGWRKKLKATLPVKTFLTALKDYEDLQWEANRIGAFAQLQFSADTQNQAALAFMAQIEELLAQSQNRILFFSLWWKALDNTNAKRLMKAAGDLRYWLEEMRHFKPH